MLETGTRNKLLEGQEAAVEAEGRLAIQVENLRLDFLKPVSAPSTFQDP